MNPARAIALAVALAGFAALAHSHAQPSAAGAANVAQPNMSGRVVTRKKLAECRRQARDAKLTYVKRRKFVRDCVNPSR